MSIKSNIIILLFLTLCSVGCYSQRASQYRHKAQRGDAAAQMFLGMCFEQGNGCQKSLDSAFYWYKRASNLGLAEAQVLLGNCYKEGRGCTKDSALAFEWYHTASLCESSLGLDAMGDCYYYGIGVQRDVIRARYYYNKAAGRGFRKSKIKYDKIRHKKDEDALIDLN